MVQHVSIEVISPHWKPNSRSQLENSFANEKSHKTINVFLGNINQKW